MIETRTAEVDLKRVSFGVYFGEFGTFKGDVRHEPLDIENKPDDGVFHFGEVDPFAATDFHQSHVGVDADLPALAGLELFQSLIQFSLFLLPFSKWCVTTGNPSSVPCEQRQRECHDDHQ